MAVRSTLVDLIARTRRLIGDPVGASQVFTSEEIQDVLDANRVEARYAELDPLETIQAGGATEYLIWQSDGGYWEADAAVVDPTYAALTPSAVDYLAGRWTFTSAPTGVYVTGWQYDIYAAAADLCDQWAAKLKLAFDFTADGATYKRSQQLQALGELARHLRGQSKGGQAQFVKLERGDVN